MRASELSTASGRAGSPRSQRDGAARLPRQKPGRSKQDYGTPPEFLAAVKRRLCIDDFGWDLAADADNAVTSSFFAVDVDSLAQPWPLMSGWHWLNPPFSNIGPWMKKAHEAAKEGGRVAVLVPAAVGSNWWRDYVHEKADVLFLNGRLTFVGCTDPYPKDCALVLYDPIAHACRGGYDVWDWRRHEVSEAVGAVDPQADSTGTPSTRDSMSLFSSESEIR